VITRAQWGTAHEAFYRDQPRIGPVARLVCHHTASSQPANPDESAGFVRTMEAYGGDGRWIEYHALIDPFGQVFEGYDVRSQGAHCNQKPPGSSSSFNTTSLGLCFIGYFWPNVNDVPTPEALGAGARWVADRVLAGDLDAAVLDHAPNPNAAGWRGHHETGAATACPGTLLDNGDLAAMMAEARQLTTGPEDWLMALTDQEQRELYEWTKAIFVQMTTPFEQGSGVVDEWGNQVTPRWALGVAERNVLGLRADIDHLLGRRAVRDVAPPVDVDT